MTCISAGSCACGLVGTARPALFERREAAPRAIGAVVLLRYSCALAESLYGYQMALLAAGKRFDILTHDFSSENFGFTPPPGRLRRPPSLRRLRTPASTSLIIAPVASLTDFDHVRWLRKRIKQGATALVESGAAYLTPAEFQVQKSLIGSEFGITVMNPVKVWMRNGPFDGVPYVDFTWPSPARIRDFSHAVPLAADDAETIATQRGKVVGIKRRLGNGTLIFLGSPAGPHLLTADPEARRWFESLCEGAIRS